VLSRLTAERGNYRFGVVKKRLQARVDELMDPELPGEFNQALMELGATVCLPKQPRCSQCPWERECQAFQLGLQDEVAIEGCQARGSGCRKTVIDDRKSGKDIGLAKAFGEPQVGGILGAAGDRTVALGQKLKADLPGSGIPL